MLLTVDGSLWVGSSNIKPWCCILLPLQAQEGELDNVIDNLQRVEDEASQIY
jgi:hypothetical protein